MLLVGQQGFECWVKEGLEAHAGNQPGMFGLRGQAQADATAIAHINVMRQDLGLLRKLDSEDRYPIFWATVGEFSAAA